jgi:hypothetical protein
MRGIAIIALGIGLLLALSVGHVPSFGTRLKECTLATNAVGQVFVRVDVANRALRYCTIEISSAERSAITNMAMWSFCEQSIEVPLIKPAEFDSLRLICFPEADAGSLKSFCRAIKRRFGRLNVSTYRHKDAFILPRNQDSPQH